MCSLESKLIQTDQVLTVNGRKHTHTLACKHEARKTCWLLTIFKGKKFFFIQFSTRMGGWLLLIFLICLHNQLSAIIHCIITHWEHRCLKNVIYEINSKYEWLVLPASFRAKFGLVFVLTLENAFYWRLHFKTNRKSKGSSRKRY